LMKKGNSLRVNDNKESFQNAIVAWQESAEIWQSLNEPYWEFIMRMSIITLYAELEKSEKSEAHLLRMLYLSEVLKNKIDNFQTLTLLAMSYFVQGKMQEHKMTMQKLSELFDSTPDSLLKSAALFAAGKLSENSGDYGRAIIYFNKALVLAEKYQEKEIVARIYRNLGSIYRHLGERGKEKAIEYFSKALKIFQEFDNKRGQAQSMNGIGKVYSPDLKSLDYFNQALKLYQEANDKNGEAIVLGNLGFIYSLMNEPQKTIKLYEQALAIYLESKDVEGEANMMLRLSLLNSDPERAIALAQKALQLSKTADDFEGNLMANFVLMSFYKRAGKTKVATLYGKQVINNYQEQRFRIRNLENNIQESFLASVEETYRDLADLLIAQGNFAQAEKVLAMLKEEEYFDFVRRDASEIAKLEERVPLNEKEKALIARYSQLADKITEIGQEFQKLDDKKRQLSQTDEQLLPDEEKLYAELEKKLSDANAAFQLFLTKELVAEIGENKGKEIELDRDLQNKLRKLGEGTVALYTVAGQDRYRVILTTPTIQIDGKTEIKIAELNKKVFEFRKVLQNPAIDPRPLGKELYDLLIKPIEKELKQANAKTLVWSLDGTLRYIPIAALSPDGKRYLAEDYQNVIITPKTRDDLSDSDADWRALGLGVSEAQNVANPDDKTRSMPFSSLPGAEKELLAIIKDENSKNENGVLLGRRFLNKDFTVTNFKNSLTKETPDGKRKYSLIHIASHFHLGVNWSNSFLVLGNNEILTLEEINNSSTINFGDVELITLSACDTGFASDSNGKEIDSLASVIQNKSGKSVLATLWKVADASTALLMTEFYRLRKENPKWTKAKALQQAQLSMLNGKLNLPTEDCQNRAKLVGTNNQTTVEDKCKIFSHPFYWSPFILIGNWR
jgi:CHAT domain-containing protein/tetratricopeptide (TPR) repeat protein